MPCTWLVMHMSVIIINMVTEPHYAKEQRIISYNCMIINIFFKYSGEGWLFAPFLGSSLLTGFLDSG